MFRNLEVLNKRSWINLIQYIKKIRQENLLICLFILVVGIISGRLIGILFAIALIILSFWRDELALVLIFFSGFLKSIEFFRNLPIDFTVLAVFLLFIISLKKIIKKEKLSKINYLDYLIILQGLLVLFSVVFISSGTWLNWWDAGRFIVFNLSLYFGLFLLSAKRKEIINIIYGILFGIVVIASSALHNLIFGKISSWHLTSFGESYSSLGLMIGLGIIFLFHNILCFKQISNQKIFSFILYGLLVIILPFLPSRHILLSLILTLLLIIFLKNLFKLRWRLIGVLFFSLTFFSIGILLAYSQGIDVKRLWSYKGAYSASYYDRIEYIKSSIDLFMKNPIFGIGMGEFMYLHGGKGNYPHNLFLESMVSFGIFGILIFWPSFLFTFKNSITVLRNQNMKKVEIAGLWFIFFFLDSNFSGSLSDFRTLWLFMGILSILYYSYQRKLQ